MQHPAGSESRQHNPGLRLFILAFGTFAVGTGSYVYLGLLSDLARDLGVSVESAGQLASVFAAAYAIGAPLLVAKFRSTKPRLLLPVAMTCVAVLLGLSAVADSFWVLVLLRGLAALGSGIYTPNAIAVGVGLVAPERRGLAIAAVMGGLTLSFLVGIPAGSFVGGKFGWEASFALAATLATIAALLLLFLGKVEVPVRADSPLSSVFGNKAVRADLAVTMLAFTGTFAVVAFIGPLLERYAGLGPNGIAGMQLLIGLGGLLGTAAGGMAADRPNSTRYIVVMILVSSVTLFSMGAIGPVATPGDRIILVVIGSALFLGSAAGFALVPLQQHRLIEHAQEHRSMALSLNQSGIFLGQAFGAMAGGLVMALLPAYATGLAGGCIVLVALWFARRSHDLGDT